MVRDRGYSQSPPSHGGGAGVPAAAAQLRQERHCGRQPELRPVPLQHPVPAGHQRHCPHRQHTRPALAQSEGAAYFARHGQQSVLFMPTVGLTEN